MNSSMTAVSTETHYELRYVHLFNAGRGYAFACDAEGIVDMDQLSDCGRSNYFFARAVVGSELSVPTVRRSNGPQR